MSKKFEYKGLIFEVFDKHMEFSINYTIEERFNSGIYEGDEIKFINKYIESDDVVLELGSSLGVTSCFISNKLSDPKNLVTIEANPNLIENIKRNSELNKLNFNIKEGAVSHNNREVSFNFNGLSHSGSIYKKTHLIGGNKEKLYGEYNNVKVTTITPIDVEEEYNKSFNVLICDIEGEEYDLLYNLYEYFKGYDKMIIEFHPNRNDSKYKISTLKEKYSKEFDIEYTKNNMGIFLKKL
jgi:FkbM family methyltransferase